MQALDISVYMQLLHLSVLFIWQAQQSDSHIKIFDWASVADDRLVLMRCLATNMYLLKATMLALLFSPHFLGLPLFLKVSYLMSVFIDLPHSVTPHLSCFQMPSSILPYCRPHEHT